MQKGKGNSLFVSFSESKMDCSCLPLPVTRRACTTAAVKLYRYLHKLCNVNQMDFEFAFWQMMYLFISPQKVYRNFHHRNETKSQFARDDPAFLVLLSSLLIGSALGFTVALKFSMTAFFKLLLYFIFVDCIGFGMIVASVMWFVTNKWMIKSSWRGYNAEWGYAFDVHLNAFCPLVVISHLGLIIFTHASINRNSWLALVRVFYDQEQFIARFLSNTTWLVAEYFYTYITFLGYKYLPFLQYTEMILLFAIFFTVVYFLSLIIGWNMNVSVAGFYEGIVG